MRKTWSFKEIAEKLGISVNTVDKQVGKALKRLREKLKEYLFFITIFCFDLIACVGLNQHLNWVEFLSPEYFNKETSYLIPI